MTTSLLPPHTRRALHALAAAAFGCAAISLPAAEPRTVPGLEITLMPIPAGTFTMGSLGRSDKDRPPTIHATTRARRKPS